MKDMEIYIPHVLISLIFINILNQFFVYFIYYTITDGLFVCMLRVCGNMFCAGNRIFYVYIYTTIHRRKKLVKISLFPHR